MKRQQGHTGWYQHSQLKRRRRFGIFIHNNVKVLTPTKIAHSVVRISVSVALGHTSAEQWSYCTELVHWCYACSTFPLHSYMSSVKWEDSGYHSNVFGISRLGLEPVTSRLWGGRFNQYATTPVIFVHTGLNKPAYTCVASYSQTKLLRITLFDDIAFCIKRIHQIHRAIHKAKGTE